MLIQCTKKLLDQLEIEPGSQVEEEPLFSWHANIIMVNRRKAVVLVNDKNRYVLVLYGLKAKDFKRLDDHILRAIREVFHEEGIKDEVIELFLNHSREIVYTKTKDRKSVARMNKACETMPFFEELLNTGSLIQTEMSKRLSRHLVGDGKNSFIHPHKEMYKDLEKLANSSIISTTAAVLKVTLDLKNYSVWRRIIVPINMTFSQLHKVLQEVFGWRNGHLYEFNIYDGSPNESENHMAYQKLLVNLTCDKEAFEFNHDTPMKLATEVRLSDYIPAKINYIYDFGDYWEHVIEIERTIEDYDKNYPVCLEGEGNTPPEDVGGEPTSQCLSPPEFCRKIITNISSYRRVSVVK